MSSYLLSFIEILITITSSIVVLYVLSVPLKNVLNRICPDEQAAVFWSCYTKIMLIIAPLVLVLIVDMLQHFSNPLDNLRLTLIAALSGMLMAVHAVGKRLGQFIALPNSAGKSS